MAALWSLAKTPAATRSHENATPNERTNKRTNGRPSRPPPDSVLPSVWPLLSHAPTTPETRQAAPHRTVPQQGLSRSDKPSPLYCPVLPWPSSPRRRSLVPRTFAGVCTPKQLSRESRACVMTDESVGLCFLVARSAAALAGLHLSRAAQSASRRASAVISVLNTARSREGSIAYASELKDRP